VTTRGDAGRIVRVIDWPAAEIRCQHTADEAADLAGLYTEAHRGADGLTLAERPDRPVSGLSGRFASCGLALAAYIRRIVPIGAVRPTVDGMVGLVAVRRTELRRIYHQWLTAGQTQVVPLLHRRLRSP
jgi:hypothetical protein